VIETAYEGDFSVVFRCRDDSVARELAVKAVRVDGAHADLARRYALREARIRALVEHPHLLPLYRLVQRRSDPLLVGPWLAGGSLRDLPPLTFPVTQLAELAAGLGRALDALHEAGWWHGDVSPGNVLFHTRPDLEAPSRPVLADLGSARRTGAVARRRDSLVVTPHVTAPEVWDGRSVDGRADLYSVGILLYQLLTGAWPFEAPAPAAYAELHYRASVLPPSDRTPLAGPAVDGVLLRALAKEPSLRYSTGAELATALRDAFGADGLVTLDTARPSRPVSSRAGPGQRTAVAAAGERLQRFAAGLDEHEQDALQVLLKRSAALGARASHETEQMGMRVFAPGAALLALEDCGAAAALAAGHGTPREVAAACDAPERSISRLLALLAAMGLLAREGDRYRLPPGPAAVYEASTHTGTPVRPLRDAATFWSQLSRWTATGEPLTHMDRPDGAVYTDIVGPAGILEAPAAAELAEALVQRGLVPERAEVLDVGAGSGIWSISVAATESAATVTAVDRPAVLEQTRVHADAAGLRDRFRALPGDWRHVSLPPSAYDVAVVANLCHLEPPEEVSRLLRRLHVAVREGGVAVVVETMPEAGDSDVGALMQDLHLALRTPGGGIYDRTSYAAWLEEARFDVLDTIPLARTGGALTAMVARPRDG
jgi:2-polyprenyl-3-methyl-5-hydroxy-6-metoxy-1,4-benzoquinol methylase/tRNA A-37 threonylcarbamoyl transferase component Bud32